MSQIITLKVKIKEGKNSDPPYIQALLRNPGIGESITFRT